MLDIIMKNSIDIEPLSVAPTILSLFGVIVTCDNTIDKVVDIRKLGASSDFCTADGNVPCCLAIHFNGCAFALADNFKPAMYRFAGAGTEDAQASAGNGYFQVTTRGCVNCLLCPRGDRACFQVAALVQIDGYNICIGI